MPANNTPQIVAALRLLVTLCFLLSVTGCYDLVDNSTKSSTQRVAVSHSEPQNIPRTEYIPSNNIQTAPLHQGVTERYWFHPAHQRRQQNGERENFKQMDMSRVNYYGIRYELPWSLFENSKNNYNWAELERLLKNAQDKKYDRQGNKTSTNRNYKVYIVLHDKTWVNQNPVNNNYPVPQDLITRNNGTNPYYYTKEEKNREIRVAKRWLPEIRTRYLQAIQAIAERRLKYPDIYAPLRVISFGESSLSYNMKPHDGMVSLKRVGYFSGADNSNAARAVRYQHYWIDMLEQATHEVASRPAKDGSTLKIAMNLNWIPGQESSGNPWLQKKILETVKNNPHAVQAIEDVHTGQHSPLYNDRIYIYSSDDNQRIVPKNRVWAHFSCDTKRDKGTTAKDNIEQGRKFASNLVIREGCNEPVPGNRFTDYERELAQ